MISTTDKCINTNSLIKRPDIASLWHAEKNTIVHLEEATTGSEKKVHWKCDKGHEWEASIASTVLKKTPCPYCANQKVCLDNCLQTVYPDIARQWNIEKNSPLRPTDVIFTSSNKKYWWLCDKGHEYETSIDKRTTRNYGCPYCSGRKLGADNSLAYKDKQLSTEWDHIKNHPMTPSDITTSYSKKVWWICSTCDHSWDVSVSKRINGGKCPQCQKKAQSIKHIQTLILKNGSLLQNNPALSREWHPTKNKNLQPSEVTSNSGKKVWWQCNGGHEWAAVVFSRNNGGNGCPYCTNQKVNNENSFHFSGHPALQEWHPTKNLPLTPKDLITGSSKKVWWQCSKEHEWEASLSSRTSISNTNCPYCSGHKVCDDNCLATLYPELLKDWDYDKNLKYTPYDVTSKSEKHVWWKCALGHSWNTSIHNRSNGGGCPKCKNNKTSYPEQFIYYFLSEIFETDNRKRIGRYEADIYLPSFSLAVEYDGAYWHKNSEEKDIRKNKAISDKGIKLIRIREEGLPSLANFNTTNINISVNPSDEELQSVTEEIFKYITENYILNKETIHKLSTINFDIPKDAIINATHFIDIEKSVAVIFPQLKKDWHPTKNGELKPEFFPPFSSKKVWWTCELGHEQYNSICNRSKSGCPQCSKVVASKEYNLKLLHPLLAIEWNYQRNKKRPEDCTPSSGQKVWWKCQKQHEWEASIDSRSSGANCPYCSGRRVTKENSIGSLFPSLLEEWNYEKNIDLNPFKIGKGSHKKVHWNCKNNHSWVAYVYSRTQGSNCPECYKNNRKTSQ